MAKIKKAYLLSYQGNSNLYERCNVKRNIVEVLVGNDAKKIQSFTDSTIYFVAPIEENLPLQNMKDLLQKKFKSKKLDIFFTLTLITLNGTTAMFDKTFGDKSLNILFLKMVGEVRKELKKPEN